MEIRQLKLFVAVAELENVSRAAARLHIAQSALSRHIRALEDELRVELFKRQGKRVWLSSEGSVFLEEARAILDKVESSRNRVALASRGISGRLRIGFHQVAGRHLMVPRAINAFRQTYPLVQLDILPLPIHEQADAIRSREMDAGIFYLSSSAPEFSVRRIQTESWGLALRRDHRLARKRKLLLSDLRNENFIFISTADAPVNMDLLHSACHKGGLVPNIVQEVHQESMLLHLVEIGMGIGFVMDSGYRPKDVITRHVGDLTVSTDLSLVWRRDNKNETLANFAHCLAQAMS